MCWQQQVCTGSVQVQVRSKQLHAQLGAKKRTDISLRGPAREARRGELRCEQTSYTTAVHHPSSCIAELPQQAAHPASSRLPPIQKGAEPRHPLQTTHDTRSTTTLPLCLLPKSTIQTANPRHLRHHHPAAEPRRSHSKPSQTLRPRLCATSHPICR